MTEKRGRKSAEELSLVNLASARKPIEPPAGLKPQEAAIFRQTVAACAANHFRKADIPVLTAFATATHLSRFYAELIGESADAFRSPIGVPFLRWRDLPPVVRSHAHWSRVFCGADPPPVGSRSSMP
jgi:hypothetical protein